MKKTFFYFLVIIVCLTLNACIFNNLGDPPPEPISRYDPVIVKRSVLESTTELQSPKQIINSGKIYIKDDFLFVGEKNEGFHVFDNSNPSVPVKKAFLRVLGASDLTIKGEVLYINNATDLIAVKPDLGNKKLEITKRVVNAFPQMISPDSFEYYNLNKDEVIVNWKLKR